MLGLEYIRVQVPVQLTEVCRCPTQEKQPKCHNTTPEVEGEEESKGRRFNRSFKNAQGPC